MSSPILFAAVLQYIFGPLILVTSIFLILVVLVQRGRGGGLTGALGGPGGQSAFGTKAGDVFTRITVVVAVFWILLCIAATMGLQNQGTSKLVGTGSSLPATGTTIPPSDQGTMAPGVDGPDLTIPSDEAAEQTQDAAGYAMPAEDAPPAPEN